jgi:hypothetical protein
MMKSILAETQDGLRNLPANQYHSPPGMSQVSTAKSAVTMRSRHETKHVARAEVSRVSKTRAVGSLHS